MKKFVIETEALRSNAEQIRQRAGVPVIAVVKADGYGFGMVHLVEILREAGITRFAVTEPEDALTLRDMGLEEEEILVMRSTAMPDEVDLVLGAKAIATVGSREAAACLSAQATRRGVTAQAHVKLDTGMGRYGFLPTQLEDIRTVYTKMPHVQVTGMYTHYHSAFGNSAATHAQAKALFSVVDKLRAEGISTGVLHSANSSAVFCYDDLMMDAVRVGSAFTGRIPTRTATGLTRVGRLESRVIEVRDVPAGHSVGYGAGFVTKRPTTIAVVPVGYTDGFSVEKKNDLHRFRDFLRYCWNECKSWRSGGKIYVTVDGKKAPVLGHVGLCHVSLDVTGLDIQPGASAVLDVNPLYLSPLVPKEYV